MINFPSEQLTLMVHSHWISPGSGQRLGPGPAKMDCMVLCRTFHTVPEQGRIGYVAIF